jgi:hypothetical protein
MNGVKNKRFFLKKEAKTSIRWPGSEPGRLGASRQH